MYDNVNAVANVFVVDSEGTLVRLTPNVSVQDEPVNPILSPDGTVVVFRDFDPINAFAGVYVVPVDGSATDPLTPLYLNATGDWVQNPSWHPDGTSVLFTDSSPEGSYTGGNLGGQIKEVTYPGGVVTTLWTPDLQSPTQREEGWRPIYSPDGTKIAFFVNVVAGGGGDLSRQGLWVMNADGSGLLHLDNWDSSTSDVGYALHGTQAVWSNDSQWLAYVDAPGAGTGSVSKIKADGTGKTLLMSPPSSTDCFLGWGAWKSDDSQVYVAAWDGTAFARSSIWLANADGSGSTEIVDNTDGPLTDPDRQAAYRLRDRLYWIWDDDPTIIKSSALDGTDIQTYFDGTSIGALLFGCTGIECN